MARAELEEFMASIATELPHYRHDQFRRYPARHGEFQPRWESYLLSRLEDMVGSTEWSFFGRAREGSRLLLAARTAGWDEEHFGISLASISPIYCPDQSCLRAGTRELLQECLAELKRAGVRFVSARVNGDQTDVLHAFEDLGFRYFETVIWPVASTDPLKHVESPVVRLLLDSEIDQAIHISTAHAYRRSHFYCDTAFVPDRVGQMYGKWIRTAWQAGDPIAVIEHDGAIAGVFAFRIDDALSAALGYTYGRMRFLALDAALKGRGLGKALFHGSMSLMKQMGAHYIDSGYSTKNHESAALHTRGRFCSAYEEVTLHLWL